ncbi:02093a8d-a285-4735-8b12-bf5ea9858239 [Thermothielavioides terrestris]|uniref:02093a8d-a285-4735-8b12-bf5ea9858239 n=1 Tax=Thermothielavioides terrestris TaxID=2587410 RepID=A0A446B7U5_9PEZI|nr:02093a8d-a285-4735-8b12-bf5ea9858239 [Thermothielavioides terrestris]
MRCPRPPVFSLPLLAPVFSAFAFASAFILAPAPAPAPRGLPHPIQVRLQPLGLAPQRPALAAQQQHAPLRHGARLGAAPLPGLAPDLLGRLARVDVGW